MLPHAPYKPPFDTPYRRAAITDASLDRFRYFSIGMPLEPTHISVMQAVAASFRARPAGRHAILSYCYTLARHGRRFRHAIAAFSR